MCGTIIFVWIDLPAHEFEDTTYPAIIIPHAYTCAWYTEQQG